MRLFWRRPSGEAGADAPAAALVPAIGSARVVIALLLMLAAAAISGLLLLEHHGFGPAVNAVNQVCGDGTTSGCETVARSRWSEVKGIPLAAMGLAFSASIALLLLLGLIGGPEARTGASAIAVAALALALVVDVALFGIQLFAIKAFCRLCLATYAFNALALVVLLPARRLEALRSSFGVASGRAALVGWGLATVALVAAALAGSAALRYRAEAHSGALLGAAPGALPSLAPAPPGSDAARYQEEARVAQEQARRLQETLDDPRKLEEYLTQKAQREFEQGPVRTFNLKGTPARGPVEAPIRVVEFSDFLCPYCRQIAGAFEGFLPQSGNRIVLYFKNYPLDQSCNTSMQRTVHPGACWVALGGICANDQGRFWAYHDKVFSAPPVDPQAKDVVRIASEVGLDGKALETCINGPAAREKLSAEIAEGVGAQVQGTPTLYINGKKLPRLTDFVPMVERESAKMGLPPLPAPPAEAGH